MSASGNSSNLILLVRCMLSVFPLPFLLSSGLKEKVQYLISLFETKMDFLIFLTDF